VRSNKVIALVVVMGAVIVAVTFLGVAKISGDEKPSKELPRASTPKAGSTRGVVVFGNVDVDRGPGLVQVFPENFPQPSTVTKVLVQEGQTVEEGQALAELDPVLADIKVAEARQGVAKAKAAQARAQALLDQAKLAEQGHTVLVAAQQLTINAKESDVQAAKIELEDKKSKLFRSAKVEMDPEIAAAEKKLEGAQRLLDSEKKKLEGLQQFNPTPKKKAEADAGVAEAKAAVGLQEAQLQEAEYGRGLMTLKARIAGKVVRSFVTEGVTFGAQTKQPAFLIQPKGPLIVRAEVDQEFASRVAKGQDAVIRDDGNPDLKWSGKVIRVSDSFLPKRSGNPEGLVISDQTRVLECVVSISAGESDYPVRVGQRVKVSIGTD
jgi:multidrug resistance efflux pump